jgi:uncharacterized membrane protein
MIMFVVFAMHLATSWYMCGVIWLVQLVHYPEFRDLDRAVFSQSMLRHQRLTTWVVGPVMLVELLTGFSLILSAPLLQRRFALMNMTLLATIWLLTVFVSVPRHERLAAGYDRRTIDSLVSTNWPRTLLWSLRACLLVYWSAGFTGS